MNIVITGYYKKDNFGDDLFELIAILSAAEQANFCSAEHSSTALQVNPVFPVFFLYFPVDKHISCRISHRNSKPYVAAATSC